MTEEIAFRIFERRGQLEDAAASAIAATLAAAVEARGRASLALAGGGTPEGAYRLLGDASPDGRLDWARVDVFWGDERFVPADDPASNVGMARRTLLDRVAAAQYAPPAPPGTAADAAAAYEETVRTVLGERPRFDLVLLGLGSDGHTASLFPNGPELAVQDRGVVASTAPEEPRQRLTFTFPLLNDARTVFFLVAGASKAAPVADVLLDEAPALPATHVRPHDGQVVWFLDRAAALTLLERGEIEEGP